MASTKKITQIYFVKNEGEIKFLFFAALIEKMIVNIPKYVPVTVPNI